MNTLMRLKWEILSRNPSEIYHIRYTILYQKLKRCLVSPIISHNFLTKYFWSSLTIWIQAACMRLARCVRDGVILFKSFMMRQEWARGFLGSMSKKFVPWHRWIFCQKNWFFPQSAKKLWKTFPIFFTFRSGKFFKIALYWEKIVKI